MNITLENSSLTQALKAVSRIAPPANGNINFNWDGTNFKIISYGEASYCEHIVPCDVVPNSSSSSSSVEFAIPLDAFKSATQGRKQLTFLYKNTTLEITSGNFHIDLATVDAVAFDDNTTSGETTEEVQTWNLTTEQSKWLKQAVAACVLEPTPINPNPALTVSLTPKRAFVCCYGDDHLAFALSKQIKGEMEVTMPVSTLASVLEVFSHQDISLVHTPNKLKAENNLCKAAISLPVAEYMDVKILLEKAQEVHKAKGKFITLEKQAVVDFLTNASALDTKERSGVTFSGTKDKLTLNIRAIAGRCKAEFDLDAEGVDFTLDKLYFKEAVMRSGDEVTVKWINENGGAVYIPGKDSYFLIATWQNV